MVKHRKNPKNNLGAAFLTFAATLLFSLSSHAALNMTPQEYDGLMKTYQDCKDNGGDGKLDCGCVAVKQLDLSRAIDARLDRFRVTDDTERAAAHQREQSGIIQQSFKSCTDKDKIAVDSYGRCTDMMSKIRNDYADFCGCFAMRYSDHYAANGAAPFFFPSDAQANAMSECNKINRPPVPNR
jgi:hypothetical protein